MCPSSLSPDKYQRRAAIRKELFPFMTYSTPYSLMALPSTVCYICSEILQSSYKTPYSKSACLAPMFLYPQHITCNTLQRANSFETSLIALQLDNIASASYATKNLIHSLFVKIYPSQSVLKQYNV